LTLVIVDSTFTQALDNFAIFNFQSLWWFYKQKGIKPVLNSIN